MKIWDADQRGDKDGKAVGVGGAFVNAYRGLIVDRITENQFIAKIYPIVGIGERADIYKLVARLK